MSDSPSPTRPSRTAEDGRGVTHFSWTRPQRRALIVLGFAMVVLLGLRYACNPVYVARPQPEHPPGFDRLADRLDPNTASLEELTALPQLGEKRAQAIIEWRQKRAIQRPGEPVFRSVEDLMVVRGIGGATVDTLKPFLTFPKPPTTQPLSP